MASTPLRDYLSGLVYARADGIFQASLDPIVRSAMQEHFAENPGSDYSQYVARQVRVDWCVRACVRSCVRACARAQVGL
jgi:hypothetical protein